jgi:L-iditol 2-dehydrogenase
VKLARLTRIREVAVVDVPSPTIRRADDVLLQIRAVGVCGSDVHYYTQGRIGSQTVEYPFAVGHEAAAVVAEVGPGVTRVKPGDRVAVEPAVACNGCDQCLAGRKHTCRTLRFLGCPGQLEGCLGEFLVMPEACCYPIPDCVSLEEAALSEPLAIGVYAVQQSVPMAGARIAILGMGPIGFSVMLPALAQGAAAVYVTDRLDYRGAMARTHGATWAGNPDRIDVVAEIRAREPLLLDAVFECCGQQEALDQGMALLKPGGKLMIIGIPAFDRYSFAVDIGRRQEICLQNVRRQNHCVQKTIDMIAAGQLRPGFMATHHFPLAASREALDLVARYGDGVLKAVVHIGA